LGRYSPPGATYSNIIAIGGLRLAVRGRDGHY
jgi:hypothetical protein